MSKIRNLKAKLSLIAMGFVGVPIGAFVSSLFVDQKIEFIDRSIQNYNQSSITIPDNFLSNTNINFDNLLQNITFDSSYSSFAMITGTSSNEVTKFNMTDGTTTKLYNNSSTSSNEKIKAIKFLPGNLTRTDKVLILTNENSIDKLKVIDWNNGNSSPEISISLGNAQLNKNKTISSKFFFVVNNFIDLDVDLFEVSNNSNNSLLIKNYKINNNFIASQEQNKQITPTTINISGDLYNSFFDSNYVITSIFEDKSNNYMLFQSNNPSSGNRFATILRLNKGGSINNINSSNLMTINLSDDIFKELNSSKKPKIDVIQNNGTINIILSSGNVASGVTTSDVKNTNTSFYYSSFSTNNFGSSTNNFSKKTFDSDIGFILDIKKTYSKENKVDGYLCLTSNNKILKFDNNFTNLDLFVDLSSIQTSVNLQQNTSKQSSGLTFKEIFTRKNDTNWYGIDANGKIHQFSGNNYLGELNSSSTSRDEIIADISFKSENELDSYLLFQKYTSREDFEKIISNNANKFVNINSYDPYFGSPIISAKIVNESSVGDGRNKNITVAFEQTIRNQSNNGSEKKVLLGMQSYTIINENLKVNVKQKSDIPSDILNKKPSQITKNDVEYILNIENAGKYNITLEPNDTFGLLTINVIPEYCWIAGEQKINYKYTVTVGSSDSPYFQIDMLNGLSGNVELVDNAFLEENGELNKALQIKYSSILPSEVSAQDILNDFIILGDAFKDNQLLNQDIIEPPRVEHVQIVPVDSEGYLYVTLTVPKIGNDENIVYSFKTASVFKKSPTSGQNAYLTFKSEDDIKDKKIPVGDKTQDLVSFLPSVVADQISKDPQWLLYFLNASNYVLSMIYDNSDDPNATLNLSYNNGLGEITIGVSFKYPIPGLNGTDFNKTYSIFAKQGSTGAPSSDQNYPTFKWLDLDANQFDGKTPAEITVKDIEEISTKLYQVNGAATSLKKEITVTPLNASGAIAVSITFYNWWEQQNQDDTNQKVPVLLPKKTFKTIITNGLRSSKDSINSIIWKSFDELEPVLQNSTPNSAILAIQSSSNNALNQLEQVAYISESLKRELSKEENTLDLSITGNNSTGVVEVNIKYTIDGQIFTTGTKISGFNLEDPNYVVTLLNDKSEVATSIKDKLPSQVTDEEIGNLINVQIGSDLTKKVEVQFDDRLGTLEVSVTLFKQNPDGTLIQAAETVKRLYEGFQTNVPKYSGTNYVIVAMSILIPTILLLTPILYIGLYKNKKDIKKFSKVLDKRLSQHSKRDRTIEVNSVKDLLSLEKD